MMKNSVQRNYLSALVMFEGVDRGLLLVEPTEHDWAEWDSALASLEAAERQLVDWALGVLPGVLKRYAKTAELGALGSMLERVKSEPCFPPEQKKKILGLCVRLDASDV